MDRRLIKIEHHKLQSGDYAEIYVYAFTKRSFNYGAVYQRVQLEIPFDL